MLAPLSDSDSRDVLTGAHKASGVSHEQSARTSEATPSEIGSLASKGSKVQTGTTDRQGRSTSGGENDNGSGSFNDTVPLLQHEAPTPQSAPVSPKPTDPQAPPTTAPPKATDSRTKLQCLPMLLDDRIYKHVVGLLLAMNIALWCTDMFLVFGIDLYPNRRILYLVLAWAVIFVISCALAEVLVFWAINKLVVQEAAKMEDNRIRKFPI